MSDHPNSMKCHARKPSNQLRVTAICVLALTLLPLVVAAQTLRVRALDQDGNALKSGTVANFEIRRSTVDYGQYLVYSGTFKTASNWTDSGYVSIGPGDVSQPPGHSWESGARHYIVLNNATYAIAPSSGNEVTNVYPGSSYSYTYTIPYFEIKGQTDGAGDPPTGTQFRIRDGGTTVLNWTNLSSSFNVITPADTTISWLDPTKSYSIEFSAVSSMTGYTTPSTQSRSPSTSGREVTGNYTGPKLFVDGETDGSGGPPTGAQFKVQRWYGFIIISTAADPLIIIPFGWNDVSSFMDLPSNGSAVTVDSNDITGFFDGSASYRVVGNDLKNYDVPYSSSTSPSDSLTLDFIYHNYSPTNVSVSPTSGNGMTRTFQPRFSDANGYGDLRLLYFKISEDGGNANAAYFKYDITNDKLYLRVNSGTIWKGGYALGSANTLANSQVTVDMSATSLTSIGEDDYRLNIPCTFFNSFHGEKKTYMYCTDSFNENSGWTEVGTYTVNNAPTVDSISPSSASGNIRDFVAKYSDADGTSDLRYLYLKIHTSSGSNSNCAYFRYRPKTSKIDLRTNAGGSWLGGLVIGNTGTLENSQVSVDVSQITATTSGNEITLTLPLVFKAAFIGAKNLYMNVYDLSYASPNWQNMGTFTVDHSNNSPENVSLSPSSSSGGWKTFTVGYKDYDGVTDLHYTYFKIATSGSATANIVYLRYRQATNKLDIRTDSGSGWTLGNVLGSSVTISNSQASVNLLNASSSLSGDDLTLVIPIIFDSSFNGNYSVYLYAMDDASSVTGWQNFGSFSVTASAPLPSMTESRDSLRNRRFRKGDRIYLDGFAPASEQTTWFVNDRKILQKDPEYTFMRKGIFSFRFDSKTNDGSHLLKGDQVLVGESLIMAGDAISLTGESIKFKMRGNRHEAQPLLNLEDENRILRLQGEFTPGMRLVFDRIRPADYKFLTLRKSKDSKKLLWVAGHFLDGSVRVISRREIEPLLAQGVLELRFNAGKNEMLVLFDFKRVFDKPIEIDQRGEIALYTSKSPQDMDVIVTKPVR